MQIKSSYQANRRIEKLINISLVLVAVVVVLLTISWLV